jgi:hypothetical protein
MRAVVIAAGDGTRWGNFLGAPKHFAPIDGQPILHRTVDLLREHTDDIVIVAPPDDLERYVVINTATEGAWLHPENGEADKFLSSRHFWDWEGDTALIYGDCYFTEEAIATIMQPITEPWHLFCRFGPNPFTGRRWGENFAFTFDKEGAGIISRGALEMVYHSPNDRNGGWELYRRLTGAPEHGDYGNATDITDWSDDLDYPSDWVEMVARRAVS